MNEIEISGDIKELSAIKYGQSIKGVMGGAFCYSVLKNNKNELVFDDFLAAFETGIEGVKQRGRSTTEEKTMLDAMVPAYDAMKAVIEASAGVIREADFNKEVAAAKLVAFIKEDIEAAKSSADIEAPHTASAFDGAVCRGGAFFQIRA